MTSLLVSPEIEEILLPRSSSSSLLLLFHTPTARYSLFVLKMLINTNKPKKTKQNRADDVVRRRSLCHDVCMRVYMCVWVCGCGGGVNVSTIKRKPMIGMTWNLTQYSSPRQSVGDYWFWVQKLGVSVRVVACESKSTCMSECRKSTPTCTMRYQMKTWNCISLTHRIQRFAIVWPYLRPYGLN